MVLFVSVLIMCSFLALKVFHDAVSKKQLRHIVWGLHLLSIGFTEGNSSSFAAFFVFVFVFLLMYRGAIVVNT